MFLKVNSCLSECHEFSTKYLGKWYISQRVFQAEPLSKGGAIAYYLIDRNYKNGDYDYLK